MMAIRVRVTSVDMNGFLGRDHHPSPDDLGKEGWVTNINSVPSGDDPIFADDAPGIPEPLRGLQQIFYVVLDDGRWCQFMGHELELIPATHNGDL